jgi:hypothetical protein
VSVESPEEAAAEFDSGGVPPGGQPTTDPSIPSAIAEAVKKKDEEE